MLKIEKIKEEILNFNHANDALRCYLARVTTKQSNIDGCCRPNLRCEECLKVSFIDLLEEYKKPVKLTKFEYEYLKVAKENEYNFIARDKDDRLFLYETKPWRGELVWKYTDSGIRIFKELFNFVKWEDEEPYSVDEILANCEVIENEKR
ncbi:hypothetical protein ACP5WA_05375 [Thomasclavelia ramosa]